MYIPPATSNSRLRTLLTMRIGLPHFGQACSAASPALERSAVLATLPMHSPLGLALKRASNSVEQRFYLNTTSVPGRTPRQRAAEALRREISNHPSAPQMRNSS